KRVGRSLSLDPPISRRLSNDVWSSWQRLHARADQVYPNRSLTDRAPRSLSAHASLSYGSTHSRNPPTMKREGRTDLRSFTFDRKRALSADSRSPNNNYQDKVSLSSRVKG